MSSFHVVDRPSADVKTYSPSEYGRILIDRAIQCAVEGKFASATSSLELAKNILADSAIGNLKVLTAQAIVLRKQNDLVGALELHERVDEQIRDFPNLVVDEAEFVKLHEGLLIWIRSCFDESLPAFKSLEAAS